MLLKCQTLCSPPDNVGTLTTLLIKSTKHGILLSAFANSLCSLEEVPIHCNSIHDKNRILSDACQVMTVSATCMFQSNNSSQKCRFSRSRFSHNCDNFPEICNEHASMIVLPSLLTVRSPFGDKWFKGLTNHLLSYERVQRIEQIEPVVSKSVAREIVSKTKPSCKATSAAQCCPVQHRCQHSRLSGNVPTNYHHSTDFRNSSPKTAILRL